MWASGSCALVLSVGAAVVLLGIGVTYWTKVRASLGLASGEVWGWLGVGLGAAFGRREGWGWFEGGTVQI